MASTTPTRPRGTIARHGRLATTSAWGTVFKGLAMLVGVLFVSGLTFIGALYLNTFQNVSTFTLEDNSTQQPGTNTYPGGVNILLIGSDTRVGQGAEFGEGEADAEGVLNDVNILFHLSNDHTHASVISIPRDTLIDTPACLDSDGTTISPRYSVMMNSILNDGGIPCIVRTVEQMGGIDIQFAGMITFRGVIEMSNAIGGVPVCVAQPIDDPFVGLNLDAGMHTLKGADALKFLRTRHGVGDGSDLARISNQQVFMSSLFRTLKSSATLTNPAKLYGLARAATQNMTLSENLNNLETMVSLAAAIASVPTERLAFVRLPVGESALDPGRVVPSDDAEVMWKLLRADQPLAKGLAKPTASDQPGQDAGAGQDGAATPTGGAAALSPGGAGTNDGAGAGTGAGTDGGAETGASVPPTASFVPLPDVDFSGQTADEQTCSNPDPIF